MTLTFEWVGFIALVLVLLGIDLRMFNRQAHDIRFREALLLSAFWIALATGFNLVIYFWQGQQKALEFFTGYLIEKSLSVDNLFVFIMLFGYFRVEPKYQHSVLFWGILGALVMRAIFIFAGVALINKFHWMIFVFGAFLVFTGLKLFRSGEEEVHPEKNPVLKLARRFLPISADPHDGRFFGREAGRLVTTSLFVVLLVVETTDVVFAIDSIPAVLAISTDPFIVFTSNVFAILGLRALFFALSGAMRSFHYLKYGLAVILTFVGVKMLISRIWPIPIGAALGGVALVLAASVLMSVLRKQPPPPGTQPG